MRPAMAFSERDDFLEVVPSFARPKETVQPKARLADLPRRDRAEVALWELAFRAEQSL